MKNEGKYRFVKYLLGLALTVLLAAVFTISLQVAYQMSFSVFGYVVVAFIFLFPGGSSIAYLAINRKLQVWLTAKTFCATVVAWVLSLFLCYQGIVIVNRYGGEHASVRWLVPTCCAAVACSVFGFVQFLGWSSKFSPEDRGRVLWLLSGVPALVGPFSFQLGVTASEVLCTKMGWRMPEAVIPSVMFGPTAVFITGAFGYFLKKAW
jgi:hypothetical protein